MRGLNWIAFNPTTTGDFFQVNIANFPVSSIKGYKFLNADFLHWRKRSACSGASNFYVEE